MIRIAAPHYRNADMSAVTRIEGEPFRNAEEAWFWTMGVLIARREGSVRSRPGIPRPCEPNDILRCLDVLYRSRRIDLIHARVLRIWGERQMVPPSSWQGGHGHAVLWREAMEQLEWALRFKGIIR
jgi:hypothetical protein